MNVLWSFCMSIYQGKITIGIILNEHEGKYKPGVTQQWGRSSNLDYAYLQCRLCLSCIFDRNFHSGSTWCGYDNGTGFISIGTSFWKLLYCFHMPVILNSFSWNKYSIFAFVCYFCVYLSWYSNCIYPIFLQCTFGFPPVLHIGCARCPFYGHGKFLH